MGMYRMMCRSVPCCRRHSSLLWTFLVIALVIYIVYSHVHPRNQLTQLIVDKLPAVEKGGFWGKDDERNQQGGDRIQHGPFPGERWPHNNNNERLADDTNHPVTPVMPQEDHIDRKYLLDNQWDSKERQNQWRNRGDRRGFATRGNQMRRGFDSRFNRFGDNRGGFRRGDDSRFFDNRNAFPRRGGWNDHRARTSYPRGQDSHRLKDQGRFGMQDSREEDHARRGWVDRNRPRFPGEDRGDGADHVDARNNEELENGQGTNQAENEDEDENHQRIQGHGNVHVEDKDQDENQNLDKDQDEDNNLDKGQDEDNHLVKGQDEDNNVDKDQDEDNNVDKDQDEDNHVDKDQDEDNNLDKDQDEDKNLDKDQDEDNNLDKDQDEDKNLDKEHDQDHDHDQNHEDQDQNQNKDPNQNEIQDQGQDKDLNLENLQHKAHADRVAAVQNALLKAGKIPLLGKAEDSLQNHDQDNGIHLDHLQHKEHADRVAAVQNALLKAGKNPFIAKSHDIDQEKKPDGSRNLDNNKNHADVQDHDPDDAEARENMRARIMMNPVLRGPPDLRDEDRRPAQIAPPVGANKEQEELPELDLNVEEVQRRREQFERRGGPENVQQGPGIVDAPPPSRLTLQSWDLGKLEETFHKYVLTKQIYCQLVVRAGRKQHGGWNLCLTLETRPMVPCLIYSFGFDTDYSFEDDVAKKYGCETHYFDPKLGSYLNEIRRSTGVTMHKYGLSDKNGYVPTHKWFVKTLATIKKQLRHTQPIDILKIDIEDNEWRSLPEMLNSGVMGQVRQLLVEVHILAKGRHTPTAEDYINYLQVMRDLYIDGFRIAAVRQDDTELPSMDGITRAQNYEILFLRIDRY